MKEENFFLVSSWKKKKNITWKMNNFYFLDCPPIICSLVKIHWLMSKNYRIIFSGAYIILQIMLSFSL